MRLLLGTAVGDEFERWSKEERSGLELGKTDGLSDIKEPAVLMLSDKPSILANSGLDPILFGFEGWEAVRIKENNRSKNENNR